MDRSPLVPLDLEALVEQEGGLQGRLDASLFDARLAAALDMEGAEGGVAYALDFSRLQGDAIGVSGTLRARLRARCQRCLEPFDLAVEVSPRLLIAATEEVESPPDWEPGEPGARPTLVALVAEELLLALPFAPRHPAGECAADSPADAVTRSGSRRPFAGLADALHRREGRNRR